MHDSEALETALRSPEEDGAKIHAVSAYRREKKESRLDKSCWSKDSRMLKEPSASPAALRQYLGQAKPETEITER